MQYTRFVLFNGPPGSGKTTISRELCRWLDAKGVHNVSDSFAAPTKHFIASALGQKYAQMAKDAPRAELAGYSVREALIDISQEYLKPRYGIGVFASWLYHRIGRMVPPPSLVVVDDCGFDEERDVIGLKRAIVIRVERDGKDFSNDSRSYLDNPSYTFNNNGDMARLWQEIELLGRNIMARM